MRVIYTPDGMERLQQRLERTLHEYRAVCDDNPAALESGDSSGWHDNFAFEENQRQMQRLALRIRELQRLLERAEVVPPLAREPARVIIGASVVYTLDDGEARRAWICGYNDGDPRQGRLSYNSPLGRALIGMEPGEARQVTVAGRELTLELLEIGPTPGGAA
jgi:transcription elongation factor GreA